MRYLLDHMAQRGQVGQFLRRWDVQSERQPDAHERHFPGQLGAKRRRDAQGKGATNRLVAPLEMLCIAQCSRWRS
jgi:hypothetical protein